jgi:hypothetical protein
MLNAIMMSVVTLSVVVPYQKMEKLGSERLKEKEREIEMKREEKR